MTTVKKTTKVKPKAKRAIKTHRPGKESPKSIVNRLYAKWAQIVKGLAGNICEGCGRPNSPEAPLNAHHIMPRQFFTGLRFNPRNGASLCPKCHKMGKYSAHKGGIWFAHWLQSRDPGRFNFCIEHADDELDCKDRKALYDIEYDFHQAYPQFLPNLQLFRVTVIRKDDTIGNIVTRAYNKKAAEFIAFCNGHNEAPIKGIVKTEPCQYV